MSLEFFTDLINQLKLDNVFNVVFLFLTFTLGGIVRGFAGFGFTLIVLPLAALILPVTSLVPAIVLLEFCGNTQILLKVKKSVDWSWVKAIFLPCLLFTPFGVWLLTILDQQTITLVICIFVFCSAIGIHLGYTYKKEPTFLQNTLAGGVAGIMNGAASMSGPPTVIHAMADSRNIVVKRASMIGFFVPANIVSIIMMSFAGIFNTHTMMLALLAYPLSYCGNKIGISIFDRSGGANFKLITVVLLLLISLFSAYKVLAA
ncbi:sulfite exporter TauE/SafE family protein [Vibrio sp.]|nr:sulfite exporter TauE/SafE family protein [Vibrio sp.]